MSDRRNRWNWLREDPFVGALGWVFFGGWIVVEYVRHLWDKGPD